MKILYVEDELSKNVPRMTRLFGKYLGTERVKKLEALEQDASGYGATPEEIKAIVEDTHLIEVEYRFPEALRKVMFCAEKYALFIIDRNLIENEYAYEEVKAIDSKYNEALYEKFPEREGDYLLQKLVFHKIDVMTRFYFLTAYSAQHEIRSAKEIETLIDFGEFTKENFVEKAKTDDVEHLLDVIENIKILNLRHENSRYLDILRTYINEDTAESFITILDEKDDDRGIENSPVAMRKIYEEILQACAERIPGMKEDCVDNYRKTILGKHTIDWLSDNRYIGVILRDFLFNISKISSVLCHANSEHPTTDTINALVYALKDIILWFEGICRRYPPK